MVDANEIVRDILKEIEGTTVTFYYPNTFETMPIISYYELITANGFAYDCAEQAQATYVQIDIWGKSGAECSSIAIIVDSKMQENRWKREMSKDMPPEDGIYHKTIRFYKQIYY